MAGTKETNCPLCGRHCSADAPSCPRGKAYFGVESSGQDSGHEHGFNGHGGHHGGAHHHHDNPGMTAEDKVLQLIRAAGHTLHHGSEADAARLVSALSDEEKRTLIGLLKKCLMNMENS